MIPKCSVCTWVRGVGPVPCQNDAKLRRADGTLEDRQRDPSFVCDEHAIALRSVGIPLEEWRPS
jgi:hypothetical protein